MRATYRGGWLGLCLAVLLMGCAETPTPLPVDIPPTPTPTLESGAVPFPLRYALDAVAAAALPPDEADLLSSTASIMPLQHAAAQDPAFDSQAFDVQVTLARINENGEIETALENAQAAPNSVYTSLALNPRLTPLDDPSMLALVRVVLRDPSANTAATRQQAAAFGYPDGFDAAVVLLRAPAHGLNLLPLSALAVRPIILQAAASAADALSALDSNQAHAVYFAWHEPGQRTPFELLVGADNVIDTGAWTIVYRTAPDVIIDGFTASGYPIPRR
ncbi:MAG: hypothetical protein SF162_00540 [bacterium]|nr:hypothetical protein [bacterium]